MSSHSVSWKVELLYCGHYWDHDCILYTCFVQRHKRLKTENNHIFTVSRRTNLMKGNLNYEDETKGESIGICQTRIYDVMD